jgi:hypothetical protein
MECWSSGDRIDCGYFITPLLHHSLTPHSLHRAGFDRSPTLFTVTTL